MPPDVSPDPDGRVGRGILLAGLGLLALLGGCAQSTALRDARQKLNASQPGDGLPDWHRSERLYLSPAGCRRIYVQVDCVAGACPTIAETEALEAFVHRHCCPAEGVIFDRRPPIARYSVGRRDEVQLALERMQLPQAYDDGQTGYVYILFYDSRLGQGGQPQRPYVRVDYPSAIFVDMAYWTDRNRSVLATALQHEMGHVLGLTKNDAHGDGSHCENALCIMHPTIKIPPAGRRPAQSSLCASCRSDLARSRNSRPPRELCFRGPVLVRKGAGYRVASMPGYTRILLDSIDSQDASAVAEKARAFAATSSGLADKCHCSFDMDHNALKDRSSIRKLLAALARARRDPDDTVAGLAEQLTRRLQASLEDTGGGR
jgi:hypothetical protein